VEKKARRGERQKAWGRGFGRTVHHLHLCTSTLHTYVVVEILEDEKKKLQESNILNE
jgi:hypothetical protein